MSAKAHMHQTAARFAGDLWTVLERAAELPAEAADLTAYAKAKARG